MTSSPVVQGGIYWVTDTDISLPPNHDRKTHPRRPVVVLTGPDTNSHAGWRFVLVAPISSESTRKTVYCVKLSAGEGNVASKCWVRVPAVQPLMKDQLTDMIGILPAQRLEEIQARLWQYLGLVDLDEPTQ
ncbi:MULTISPECIES: type II toxin-antitoxin system PemK/MazF family toxin [Micromonospora]|nr:MULTISPECIES: type II toxin-antitoxin system PemK/MazF family toxin [Micromonospora]MDG4803738.1 type II toxin-antitoxin system PemK/MazF family toxin [Micromonospora sp. WMMD980]